MKITVKAVVHPTEDKEKVKRVINRLFGNLKLSEEKLEDRLVLVGKGDERKYLERFYILLRSQRILDSAREVLIASRKGNKMVFELNKQAGYMGLINFSEASQLGPVEVEIYDEDLEGLINWLAPQTKGGKIIK
jgi:hypothetical protein